MPEKAKLAGTKPATLQIALVNHPNLPKCNSDSTNRILSFRLSGEREGRTVLKKSGNAKYAPEMAHTNRKAKNQKPSAL
jgi:hypothetical protein